MAKRTRRPTAEPATPSEAGDHWADDLARIFETAVLRSDAVHAVLDWDTGLPIAARFPTLPVFSPLPGTSAGGSLPYLDATIDVVVVGGDEPWRFAEARRVATGCVVVVTAGADGKAVGAAAEWVGEPPRARLTTSIVIPTYNRMEQLLACLLALEATLPAGFAGEVIVVDDASTDETAAALAFFAGRSGLVRPLPNSRNVGFVESCNRGAAEASGDLLLFLNHDTEPTPGWLAPILALFERDPRVGAVGSRLLGSDGRVQEAGGGVFRDGSCANFGRGLPFADPLVSFVRDVDYCSGAALATRRALFAEVGSFDARYRPAYYEDVDYCTALWERGYAVVYQPASVVLHDEGSAYGRGPGSRAHRLQEANREVFVGKWRHALGGRPRRPARFDLAAWERLALRPRGVGGG